MDELDKIIQNINIYNTIQQQYRSQTEKIREEVEEIEKRISKLQKEINDGKDTMELVNQPEQNKQAAENVIEEENCSDLKKNNFHRSATMFSRLKYRVLFGIECVFAMLSLGTVFMKWFDINYIPRVINEYPSEKPFGNLYYLVTALMELEDSRYLDDLALPILSMMSVCILVCLMVLFLGNSLWRVMIQKEKERHFEAFSTWIYM